MCESTNVVAVAASTVAVGPAGHAAAVVVNGVLFQGRVRPDRDEALSDAENLCGRILQAAQRELTQRGVVAVAVQRSPATPLVALT